MILEIVTYGHPALRAKGRRVAAVDERIEKLAADMLETMRDAEGVGLAAQQVGRPLQLCVVDVSGVEDRPSWLRVDGKDVDPAALMPMILLNPEIEPIEAVETGVEGCLSFPGILADITRPAAVRVRARTLAGKHLVFEAGGLLARALQHEHDHLNGILFIDHLSAEDRESLLPELDKLSRAGMPRGV